MTEPDNAELDETDFADEEGAADETWDQLPPEREFFASPYDPPIKSLVQEISDKELVVRPSFQRNQTWDGPRKSKFVESILLSIPVPTLFFAEDEGGTKVVVDGQQRLLALKDFLDNRFALSGLKVLAPLNGKRVEDLTERQQRIIKNRTLRCLVISARSDSEIRFEVFERLNQGGVPLNAQEVRHCVYRGELNDLLHELANEPHWLRVYGRERPHPRMLDCELILRFFALRSVLPGYSPPLKKMLTNFMEDNRHLSGDDLAVARRLFQSAVHAVAIVFPDHPFRRLTVKDGDPTYDKSLNRAVFDIQMQMLAGLDESWIESHAGEIRDEFQRLCLGDGRFADSLNRATADKSRMNYRLREWAQALIGLGAELADPRIVPPPET